MRISNSLGAMLRCALPLQLMPKMLEMLQGIQARQLEIQARQQEDKATWLKERQQILKELELLRAEMAELREMMSEGETLPRASTAAATAPKLTAHALVVHEPQTEMMIRQAALTQPAALRPRTLELPPRPGIMPAPRHDAWPGFA
jgi:hypothetical protein